MNEDARRAVFVAHQEAVERGAAAIDTEHLLVGVIRSDPRLATRVAVRAGYEQAELIRRLDQLSPRRTKPSVPPVEMPLSKRSSDVLGLARQRLSVELTPTDLLVALIKVDGVASRVLRDLGVTEAIVRDAAADAAAAHGR
jgi:ATP-dependent Clp protease ATP-binding subunit ClpC